jgi:hypothetical protein
VCGFVKGNIAFRKRPKNPCAASSRPIRSHRHRQVDTNDENGVAALRRRLDEPTFDLLLVNAGIATNNVSDFLPIHRHVALPGLFNPFTGDWHIPPP